MKYLYVFCCMALLSSLHGQESLLEIINKYYENLDRQAEMAAKKGDVQNAYENFSRIPTLEEFLQYNSVLTGQEELKKIRKQNKGRLGFFYPASLYEDYKTLLLSLDRLKMAQIAQKVRNLEQELGDIAQDKIFQEKALNELLEENKKLRSASEILTKKIDNGQRKVEEIDQRLQKIDRVINSNRSLINGALDEELRLIAIIRRLDAEIVRELNDVTRVTLISRRNAFERQRISLRAEANDLDRDNRKLQEEFLVIEKQLVAFTREIPLLEEKLAQIKPDLEKFEEKQQEIEQKLEEYNKQLRPLTILKNEQQQIIDVAENYQKWWREAKQRPKHHFLLALYVLEKFPKDNINVKIKKWYGLGGIVEIHYW